jgi:hypothetical protein
MSFNMNEVRRLEAARVTAAGLKVWEKYQRLVTAADQAAHGSPAEQELGEFRLQWLADPGRVIEAET